MKNRFLAFILILWHCGFVCAAQTHDLNYYLQQAFANSPLIKDYQNQILTNSLDSQRIRALYKPQVTVTSNDVIAPTINGFGYDQAVTNGGVYNALINANKSFIGGGYMRAQYLTFGMTRDSLLSQRKISVQDLRRTVVAQYITVYGSQQQLEMNEDIHALLENEETILKKLTRNNVYRQTDYLTFLVTYEQQYLQLKQLRIQHGVDLATLNYLCGIFDTTNVTISLPELKLEQLPDEYSSVFFLRYKIDSMQLENNLRLVNYLYHPRVATFANAGLNTTFVSPDPARNLGFSVGLDLLVPIYDGHQRKLQINKIKLQMNTNANYRDFFLRQYHQQTAMLRQQLTATELLLRDIDDQIKYTKGLIEVNEKLMMTGDVKIADYVIAINNYLIARNLLTQNSIGRMQIINQINYWNK